MLIDWAKSDDGLSVTRTHKGFKHIELLVEEDSKTIWLYEQWETKEEHQAYLNYRMENGFGDFMGEILEGEFSLSYLSNSGA
jgi:quinol monooxygenase YgiN